MKGESERPADAAEHRAALPILKPSCRQAAPAVSVPGAVAEDGVGRELEAERERGRRGRGVVASRPGRRRRTPRRGHCARRAATSRGRAGSASTENGSPGSPPPRASHAGRRRSRAAGRWHPRRSREPWAAARRRRREVAADRIVAPCMAAASRAAITACARPPHGSRTSAMADPAFPSLPRRRPIVSSLAVKVQPASRLIEYP